MFIHGYPGSIIAGSYGVVLSQFCSLPLLLHVHMCVKHSFPP